MSTLVNSDLFIVQRPNGTNAGTYKLEWQQILANIASSPAVNFKGVADFTNPSVDPANGVGRVNGDMWVNTTDGTFAWANPEDPNQAVKEGDNVIWDNANGVWRFLGSVGGNGGPGNIQSVDANAPLSMFGGNTVGDVVVQSRVATKTNSGHVERLATDSEVSKNGVGGSNAVVTADQLRATNTALDAATAGGVTDVTGNNPENADIPGFWQTDDAKEKYDTPPIGVIDKSNNVKEVSVRFATEGQVGVNYLAPAGTGASIEFKDYDDGDSPERDSTKLDNLGAMTTRRTFVNFVPRNFNALNLLPGV